MNAPDAVATRRTTFQWDDPLLLETQLSEEERMVRNTAHDYAQEKLMPRVRDAFRHETSDPSVFPEMGVLGLLADANVANPKSKIQNLQSDEAHS